MEEEINYDVMRYDLDEEGYISKVYFGCSSGTCTAYEGTIPSGYDSLEDWAENANIRAYKIANGNLIYDENRDNELQSLYEQEAIDNSFVTHKEIYGLQKEIEDIQELSTTQYTKETAQGKIIELENVKRVIPKIKITGINNIDKIDLIANKINMLPNEGIDEEISGLSISKDSDGLITLNGTVYGTNLIDWSKPTRGTFENDVLTITTSNIAYANGSYDILDIIKDNPGKKLCFWCENYSFSGEGIVQIIYTQNGTQKYYGLLYKNGDKSSFLIPDDTSGITYARLGVYTNNTSSTTGEYTTTLTKPMLYFGEISNPPTYERFQLTTTEYNLAGSSDNTSPIFVFKKDEYYTLSGIERNYFYKDFVTYNKRLSGIPSIEINDNNYFLTDYIEVNPNEIYIGNSVFVNLYNRIAFYDTDKNYISKNDGGDVYTFTTPEDTAYVRFAKANEQLDTFTLQEYSRSLLKYNFYNYDGTDRELVGSYSGGSINFDTDKPVTHITIAIPTNIKFQDITITPMLNYGSQASEYEKYEVEKASISLADYTGSTIDYVLSEIGENTIVINGNQNIVDTDDNLILFSGYNVIYAIQDVSLDVEYCINNLALEGTITKNNNFKVLEDGSIEAHNGYFSGELNANTGNIGGFSIGVDRFTSNIIPSKDFTTDDITKVQQYINGTGSLTDEELILYDLNEDGVVNLQDLVLIQSLIISNVSSEKPGTLEINSKSPIKTFSLKDGDGNEIVNIGLLGANFPKLSMDGTNIMDFIKEQNVIWGDDMTSGMYMIATHTANLKQKVSDQKHGIVLVFCYYNGVADTNYNWQSFFVPKELVAMDSSGHAFILNRPRFQSIGSKYLYISDTAITGHADNTATGTANGITYANNKFVLRFVIGV